MKKIITAEPLENDIAHLLDELKLHTNCECIKVYFQDTETYTMKCIADGRVIKKFRKGEKREQNFDLNIYK